MTLNILSLPAAAGVTAPTLLVMLAGAYDTPADFMDAGFGAALHASGRALDLVLVESDLAAVCDGSLAARLEAEIIAPQRAVYRQVLTGGISIGGITALMHADLHPGGSDGLVLLAPYPGNRSITREIASAGGLATWQAGDGLAANDERCGWRALQRAARTRTPPVWLGFGHDDRFAGGHALMAAHLPAAQICRIAGGHDWPTWLQLWQSYLSLHPLQAP
jgi:pimeloyl-ACP methyl ester carboxylesterase